MISDWHIQEDLSYSITKADHWKHPTLAHRGPFEARGIFGRNLPEPEGNQRIDTAGGSKSDPKVPTRYETPSAMPRVGKENMGPGSKRFGLKIIWLWVKHMYPKWNPGKWKLGLQPAVVV